MKILFVNKFLYPNGGSETYIFELGKQLTKIGHEVQYFGMEHPDRVVGNSAEAYTTNMDFHDASAGESGKLKRVFNKLSMPFKIIYSFEARKKIRNVLDDFAPDVIHLNNINFQITPSIIYEVREWEKEVTGRHVKLIFTAHDYQWICPNHMMYIPQNGEVCERCCDGKYYGCFKHKCIHNSSLRSLIGAFESYYYKLRKTYGMVDAIICPSYFLYDKFSAYDILRDKLVVMHNFVNSDITKCENDLPSGSGQYVLYFGRYDVQKGIRTLLEAAKRLPDIQFVFAGKGPLNDEIVDSPNVRNIGFKTGKELSDLINGARFTVYPSEWFENCPFSIMESEMYGKPVIGSDIGGIPELIDSENVKEAKGLLFEPGDVDSLERAINKLWNDSTLLSELSANCSKNSFDSLEEYANKLTKLYLA